jgi:hypothetical protein
VEISDGAVSACSYGFVCTSCRYVHPSTVTHIISDIIIIIIIIIITIIKAIIFVDVRKRKPMRITHLFNTSVNLKRLLLRSAG